MSELWQSLISALDSPTGEGFYALLVLLVLSAISLLLQRRSGNGGVAPIVNRGLLALMGLRLLQLPLIALGLFRSPTMFKLLPALERGVHLLSLVLLVWLWWAAEERPAKGFLRWGLIIGSFTTAIMLLFWRITPDEWAFNYTDLDYSWGILSLLALISILVSMFRRKAQSWQPGLGLFGLLALGHILQLLLADPAGDFPLFVQVANLLALPLLYRLPQPAHAQGEEETTEEFEEPVDKTIPIEDEAEVETEEFFDYDALDEDDSEAGEGLPSFELDQDPEVWEGCEDLSRELAAAMEADACLLSSLSGDNLAIECGYDQRRQESLLPAAIALVDLPRLASGLQRGRAVRLAGADRHTDIEVLQAAFGLEKANFLMATLVPNGDDHDQLVAILLRATSPWLMDDQELEGVLAGDEFEEDEEDFDWEEIALDQVEEGQAEDAAPGEERAEIEPEPETLPSPEPAEAAPNSGELAALRAENEQYRQDVNRLLDHIDRLQPPAAVDGTLARQAELIEELQRENEELRQAADSLEGSQGPVSVPSSLQAEQAKEELRLALEQVAALQTRLDEAQQAAAESAGKSAESDKIPADKAEVIASIAQELRQPLSSILGYTDLLLSESVGILGALQRNFLERVRNSTTRMNTLIDNLIHIAELDSAGFKLEPKPVDLTGVIDDAIGLIRPHLQEKEIILRVDMPSHLPEVHTDRDAVQQILFHLLQNADAATPAEGEITLRAFTEQQPELGEFVMLQVSDSGGGIPEDDLPRVFSRVYRAKNPIIQGVGDTGVGLTIAETLTEALGGRIWVESEEGVGATFSVLMPLGQGQTN